MSSVLLTAHLVKTLRHLWVPIGLISLQPGTLCYFLFLICYLQTKTSSPSPTLSLLPRAHMSLSRLTPSSPPLCFHFKMFYFTYHLLLWFWAPATLTCSSSPSLPGSYTQSLVTPSCMAYAVPSTSSAFIVWLTLTPLKWQGSLRAVHFKSLDSSNKCPL